MAIKLDRRVCLQFTLITRASPPTIIIHISSSHHPDMLRGDVQSLFTPHLCVPLDLVAPAASVEAALMLEVGLIAFRLDALWHLHSGVRAEQHVGVNCRNIA
jgi:hypothetical protein